MTPDHKKDLDNALLAYWLGRDGAKAAQLKKGLLDPGERAGVTSGAHLDGIARLLAQACIEAGAPRDQVFYKIPQKDPEYRKNMANGFTLPGYYRPTKQWDLVVHFNKNPVVVIELKSQNGPSYSNNANNRAEEAIGNAVDLSKACEAGLIPCQPWTGYVYVIEDDIISRLGDRGKTEASFLDQDPIFSGWSYIRRVDLLCRRLVENNYYDSAWAIATSRPVCPVKPDSSLEELRKKCPQYAINKKVLPEVHEHRFGWNEPNPQLNGYVQFIAALTTEIRKYYPAGPTPDTQDKPAQAEFDLGLS